jgi:hypothetical protein
VLHVRKKASILLNADIARAFDSVSWSFLLVVMQHMEFSQCWMGWVSTILALASTQVLLNGSSGVKLCHGHGLRQGDPLLPMLFLLVMEVLGALLRKADEWALLQDLGVRGIPFCGSGSLYADDVVLFLRPVPGDMQIMWAIFDLFQEASGLLVYFISLSRRECHD